MANLIITIISIGLVAIAAIMGIYYGGLAFQQGEINADAAAIISSAQQILAAERIWATNHNQPDVSGMPNTVYDSGGLGLAVAAGAGGGIGALVSDHELTAWPNVVGSDAPASPTIGTLSSPTASTSTVGAYDLGTWNIGGYQGSAYRALFAYKGGNYVAYMLYKIVGSSSFTASDVKHPALQIGKSINNSMRQIASNADTSTVATIGVPSPPTGFTTAFPIGYTQLQLAIDSSGNIQTNYCYLINANRDVECVFGPS